MNTDPENIIKPIKSDVTLSERDYDMWKLHFEKIYDGAIEAGRSVNKNSLILITIIFLFFAITYGSFLNDKINIPFISLEFSKWDAAILGPILISIIFYRFACSYVFHLLRLKTLLNHLKVLYNSLPDAHPLRVKEPEYFLGNIIYPSLYSFLDFFYIKKQKLLSVIIWIFLALWFMLPPYMLIHMSYLILTYFKWNIILIILFSLCILIAIYSISTVISFYKRDDITFDFS